MVQSDRAIAVDQQAVGSARRFAQAMVDGEADALEGAARGAG